jgi:predicted permease
MEIPLLRGRLFTARDWDLQNVVINEAMAHQYWSNEDPLGKRINICSLAPQPCWFSIIGVVGNVHQFGLDAQPTDDLYLAGGWTPEIVIRASTEPTALAAAVTTEIHRADPNLPITRVLTMDNLLSETVSPRKFSAVLLIVFAVVALLLAAVGIYGVMSRLVAARTNELGIRMALGAAPLGILRLILARGAKLAAAGVVLGLAGAFAVTRFLSSLLFGVTAFDPLTFVAVSALLVLVALLACYIPARRATRVDPIVALRYE